MENENGLENKPIDLFGNMSNKQMENVLNRGKSFYNEIKASDEKTQNNLNEWLKEIASPDTQIYEIGRQKGLHEAKNSGFWAGTAAGVAFGIALGVCLSSKNKNS